VENGDADPRAMITKVRTAHPSIMMDGKDWYGTLAPYLLSLKYEDNCDGQKADDLEIQLADRDRKFISSWMPQKGAFLDAGIITERWFSPNAAAISLDCGRFWIDSVDFQLPDHTVSVKATSIPTNSRIKGSKETRGWEDANLKDIASQIAGENSMAVDYLSQINPRYRRTEQQEESGLAFLKKRANNAKLAIKVHRNKIVIFDEEELEKAEPKFSLLFGEIPAQLGLSCYRMSGGEFSTKLTDTTRKAKVKHTEVETGDTVSGEHEEADEEGESSEDGTGISIEPEMLDQNVNEDTDAEESPSAEISGGEREGEGLADWNTSDSASTLKAKSVVREKNKDKNKAKVDLSIGNPLIAAGMTFNLVGVGQFDGKWFIESASHEVGPEYKTSLSIRRCLKGY
jgi:phage protein D